MATASKRKKEKAKRRGRKKFNRPFRSTEWFKHFAFGSAKSSDSTRTMTDEAREVQER